MNHRTGPYRSINRVAIATFYLFAALVLQGSFHQSLSAQAPRLIVQYGHSNRINDAVFSTDGKLVASAGAEGAAILWDVSSGRELRRFTGHVAGIVCIAFSPSSKYLLTGGGELASQQEGERVTKADFSVRVWDVATGAQLARFSGHRKPVTSVSFSPVDDNVVLSSSVDGSVRSWNWKTGGKRTIWQSASPVNAAKVSPNGKIVAIGGGDTRLRLDKRHASSRFDVRLVNAATGRIIRNLTGHTNTVGRLVFSPDGNTLISTTLLPATELSVGSAETRLWAVGSGRLIEKLDQFHGPAAFLAGNAFLAIGCADDDLDYVVCILERTAQGLYSRSGVVKIGKPADPDAYDGSREGIVSVVASFGSRLLYVRSPINTGGSAGHIAGRSRMLLHDLTTRSETTLAGASEPFRNIDREWSRALNTFDRLKFANDNVSLLSGSTVWNTETSQTFDLTSLRPTPAPDDPGEIEEPEPDSFLLSNKGHLAAIASAGSAQLVELVNRRTIVELPGLHFARFTDDDSRLMVSDGEQVFLFDTVSGKEVFSTEFEKPPRALAGEGWEGFSPNSVDLAITPDGKYIFLQEIEKLRRVNTQTRETRGVDVRAPWRPFLAMTPDGQYVVAGEDVPEVINTETGSRQYVFKDFSKAPYGEKASFRFATLKISPDVRHALIVGEIDPPKGVLKPSIPALKMMDILTGKEVWFSNDRDDHAFAFSQDNNYFGTVDSEQKSVSIRDRKTYAEIRQITVADALIQQITFSPNSKLVLIKTEDGATRMWNVRTGIEICRLLSLKSGNWVAVKPDDGRFDTGNLEDIQGVHWIMSDRPFEPVPLEVFMRQYYEPGLLRRVLKCTEENTCDKEFKRLPSISEINRVQAQLSEPRIVATENGAVDVTIEVESAEVAAGGTDPAKKVSGVYDLRLFRDGQLVGTSTPKERIEKYIAEAPKNAAAAKPDDKVMDSPDDRAWRAANNIFTIKADNVKIVSPTKAEVTLRNMKLPREGRNLIEFTAYAFNSDRVKSETVRMLYKIGKPQTRVGRAYLISIGVNASENKTFDLKYAANDARKMQEILGERLNTDGKQYSEIVSVPLISDHKTEKYTEVDQAKKSVIKGVFALLAGNAMDVTDAVRAQIPNADKVKPVEPEDTLIITYAGHGYADRSGIFYLVPNDIGADTFRLTSENVGRMISSDELSLWMQDITAAEMIMVIDACHSSTAVQGEGFKPGPMGSRGLGQLAYDKGMRILSATQSNNVALELGSLQQGLLSFALLEDGIVKKKADTTPADGKLTAAEWLGYAVKAVPKLYQDVLDGKRSIIVNGVPVDTSKMTEVERGDMFCEKKCDKKTVVQQPTVFDFRRNKTEPNLLTLR